MADIATAHTEDSMLRYTMADFKMLGIRSLLRSNLGHHILVFAFTSPSVVRR